MHNPVSMYPPTIWSPPVQELKLFTKSSEREKFENLADLFAIVVSMEHLEKAYIRDSIPATEYTPACAKLLAQFKTAIHLAATAGTYTDLDTFMQTYQVGWSLWSVARSSLSLALSLSDCSDCSDYLFITTLTTITTALKPKSYPARRPRIVSRLAFPPPSSMPRRVNTILESLRNMWRRRCR